MDNLYGYFLHYNPYTKYWNAVSRDKANQYLNGTLKGDDVLKNKDVNKLIGYLSKNK